VWTAIATKLLQLASGQRNNLQNRESLRVIGSSLNVGKA